MLDTKSETFEEMYRTSLVLLQQSDKLLLRSEQLLREHYHQITSARDHIRRSKTLMSEQLLSGDLCLTGWNNRVRVDS
jgi:hypothetical protein